MDIRNKIEVKQYLVDLASLKLQRKNHTISEEYKYYLEKLSKSVCPDCNVDIEVDKFSYKEENNQSYLRVKFRCGHKHSFASIKEKIKIWEKVKAKVREKDKRPGQTYLIKTEPARNPKYSKGVEIKWNANRKKDIWEHEIKDLGTGKILHSEHESLKEHKK